MKTSAVLKPWLRSVETIRIEPKAAPRHSSAKTSSSRGSSRRCGNTGREAAAAAAATRATYALAAAGSDPARRFAGAASWLLVSSACFIRSARGTRATWATRGSLERGTAAAAASSRSSSSPSSSSQSSSWRSSSSPSSSSRPVVQLAVVQLAVVQLARRPARASSSSPAWRRRSPSSRCRRPAGPSPDRRRRRRSGSRSGSAARRARPQLRRRSRRRPRRTMRPAGSSTWGASTVLLSSVTAALRASSLPSTVAPVFSVIDVEGEDRSLEARGRPERRRASDLPEDVARRGAVDELHLTRRRGDERRRRLEDEDGSGCRPARRA